MNQQLTEQAFGKHPRSCTERQGGLNDYVASHSRPAPQYATSEVYNHACARSTFSFACFDCTDGSGYGVGCATAFNWRAGRATAPQIARGPERSRAPAGRRPLIQRSRVTMPADLQIAWACTTSPTCARWPTGSASRPPPRATCTWTTHAAPTAPWWSVHARWSAIGLRLVAGVQGVRPWRAEIF